MKVKRRRVIFHLLGLSVLGGTLFLTIYCFCSIVSHGYFFAVEPNLAILVLELALILFGLLYWLFMLISQVEEAVKT